MMNKEQAIQTLQENAQLLHFEHPHLGLEEAIGVVIEALSKHSLPSNLDEAAENYYENDCPYDGEARVVNREHDVWFPSQAIEDAFKAGAEWMAGQGVSLSHLIAWYIQSVDAHEPAWTKEHLEELIKDYILIHKNCIY